MEKIKNRITELNEMKEEIGAEKSSKFEFINKSPLNTLYLDNVKPTDIKFTLQNEYIRSVDLPDKKVNLRKANNDISKTTIKDQRTDIPTLVTSDEENRDRILYIDYSKIFNRDDLDDYDGLFYYDMSLKAYYSIIDSAINDLNYTLNEYPEIAFKLLNLRTTSYREKEKYTDIDFFEDIKEIIMDRRLRSFVKEVIEHNYDVNMDEKNKNNKRKKKELQITDQVNKSLLASGFMQRILTPFISQYLIDTEKYYNVDKNARFNQCFIHIFTFITSLFSKEYDIDNINKLYKLVQSRIQDSNHNNKVMWGVLNTRGEDNDTAIYEFMVNKLIRNVLCKLDPNTSAVSLLSTVTKNSIEFKFKIKHKFKYYSFNLEVENGSDDEMDNMEKHTMHHYHKRNELEDLINTITMKEYIEDKFKEYGITEEEFGIQFNRFKRINDFQKLVLDVYFEDKFKIVDYNRSDIISLLIIMSRELARNNMNNISKIVLGKVVSGEKGRNSGKTSYDILSDPLYQEAINRYTIIEDIVSRDNFILKLASVHGYDFEVINEDLVEEIFTIEDNKKNFTSEISEFISMI